MTSQEEKKATELLVAQQFLKEQHSSDFDQLIIENREPPEPDILCTYPSGETIAYELCEICSEDIARAEHKNHELPHDIKPSEPARLLTRKLSKPYQTPHTIELLLYVGRTMLSERVILDECNTVLENAEDVQFRKIWLWGDQIYLLYDENA